jgi:hypothetical protein
LHNFRMGIGMIRKRRIGLFPHNAANKRDMRSMIKRSGGNVK